MQLITGLQHHLINDRLLRPRKKLQMHWSTERTVNNFKKPIKTRFPPGTSGPLVHFHRWRSCILWHWFWRIPVLLGNNFLSRFGHIGSCTELLPRVARVRLCLQLPSHLTANPHFKNWQLTPEKKRFQQSDDLRLQRAFLRQVRAYHPLKSESKVAIFLPEAFKCKENNSCILMIFSLRFQRIFCSIL